MGKTQLYSLISAVLYTNILRKPRYAIRIYSMANGTMLETFFFSDRKNIDI